MCLLSFDAFLMPSRHEDWQLVIVHLKWIRHDRRDLNNGIRRKKHAPKTQIQIEESQIIDSECSLTLISPRIEQFFFKDEFYQSSTQHFVMKSSFNQGDFYFTWFLPTKILTNEMTQESCNHSQLELTLSLRTPNQVHALKVKVIK